MNQWAATTMKASELINLLAAQVKKHGDHPLVVVDSHLNTCEVDGLKFLRHAHPTLVMHVNTGLGVGAKASTLLTQLQAKIRRHGDQPVVIHDTHCNTCEVGLTEFMRYAHPTHIIHTK